VKNCLPGYEGTVLLHRLAVRMTASAKTKPTGPLCPILELLNLWYCFKYGDINQHYLKQVAHRCTNKQDSIGLKLADHPGAVNAGLVDFRITHQIEGSAHR